MAGFIYCIQMGEGGPVKIGHTTKDPKVRVKQLQTGNPIKLELRISFPGPVEGEQRFHEAFANDRLEGEWFTPSKTMFAALEAVKNHGGGLETIPPLTERGREMLEIIHQSAGPRKIYPDGTRHNKMNWDETATTCAVHNAAYEKWREGQ